MSINKIKIIKNGYPNLPSYLQKIINDKYPKLQLGGNLNINSKMTHLDKPNSKIDIDELYELYISCLDYLNMICKYPQQEHQIKQLFNKNKNKNKK